MDIEAEPMDKTQLAQVKADPMSDAEIKHYLPHARILTYQELTHFPSLQALLPKPKDFVVLLYESSPNNGHWVCVMKYDGKYEYFDPYGGKPDAPLKWIDENTREQLGAGTPVLSQMLAKVGGVHNTTAYQKLTQQNNSCGRHVIHRILAMLDGFDLDEYKTLMEHLRKELNTDYDGVVTMRIPFCE
jgi:hypothetical protein